MKAKTPRTRRSVRFSVDDSNTANTSEDKELVKHVENTEETVKTESNKKSKEVENSEEKSSVIKSKAVKEKSEAPDSHEVAMETEEATEMDSEISQSVIRTRQQKDVKSEVSTVSDSVMIVDSEETMKDDSQEEKNMEEDKTEVSEDVSNSQSTRRSRRSKVGVADVNQSQTNTESASDVESISTATNESQESSSGSQSQRRSRRVTLMDPADSAKNKANQSDSSQESQTRRKPRSHSPKKPVGANIDKWVVKSPRKPQQPNISLAEETQQFSPNKENRFLANKGQEDICVEETPVKMEKGCVIVDMSNKEDSSRNLFSENILSESQVFTVQNQDSTPSKAEFAVPLKTASPVVKLQRLSPQEINVAEVPSNRKGSLRRRSSMLRFSKASMETLDNSKENVNMDDMVPSSQDSFGFQTKMAATMSKDKDVTGSQQAQNFHSSFDFSGKITSVESPAEKERTDSPLESELPMDVDPVESSQGSAVEGKKEEESPAADVSSQESSEDLGSTLINRPKRRRMRKSSGEAKKVSSDSSQDVEEHLRRTKRTPKKKKCQCGGPDHDHDHSDTSFTELMTSSQESTQNTPDILANKPLLTLVDDDNLESSVEPSKDKSSQSSVDSCKDKSLQSSEKQDTEVGQLSDVPSQESLKASEQSEIENKTPKRKSGKSGRKKKMGDSPSLKEENSSQESLSGRTCQSQEAESKSDTTEMSSQEDSEGAEKKNKKNKKDKSDESSKKTIVIENEIISPVKTRKKSKASVDEPSEKPSDNDSNSKKEKSLDDIVNKKCNLDHDSDSEDDVPLTQLKPVGHETKESSEHSDDDMPLMKLKETGNDQSEKLNEASKGKGNVNVAVYSCVELFPGSEEQPVEEENKPETDSSFNSSTEESLRSSQKKNKQAGLARLEKSLSIDMRSPKSKKILRSSGKGVVPTRTLSLAKRAQKKNKKKSPHRVSAKSKRKEETKVEPETKEAEEPEVIDIIKDEDTDAANVDSCTPLDELAETPMETTANEDKSGDISEAKAVIIDEQSVDVKPEEPEASDTMKLLSSSTPGKPVEDAKPVLTRKVVSPPKKGKPFDLPETPTSGTKHRSRASMILERARMVCINKASLQNDLNKRKFTSLRPTTGSPRMILHPKRSGILKQTHESPTKNGPMNGNPDSPKSSQQGSPKFRPVSMPRVYSPSASPSAGILKKRKLTEERYSDSPSPPNKVRKRIMVMV